jgi:hypothetical protein
MASLNRRTGMVFVSADTLFLRKEGPAVDGRGSGYLDKRITSMRRWTRAGHHALLLRLRLEAHGHVMCDVEAASRQICGLEECGCVL